MTKEIEVFMPGRLCILGEHSDWAASYRKINPNIEKGYALIAGLNLGIYIKCKISNRYKYSFLDNTIDLSYKEVISTNNTDFFSYVVSSMKQILLNYNVGGIDIVCEKMTLPMKKGLASSAAICMSIIRAYNLLYELGLSIREEMDLAYIAERSIGSKCGKLDQLCAFGKGVRLACIDGDEVTVTTLIPAKTLKMLLVDLHGSKNTKKILDDLNAQYPYSNSEKTDRLYEFLGVKNKETIFAAIEYIENGDANSLGKVMNNYQKQFDKCVAPYSDELKAPLLHRFIGASEKIDSIIACKGVGSQGDGTVQLLLSDKMDEEKYKSLVNMIIRNYGYSVVEFEIEKPDLNALVPIAGKGSRLWPYTKCVHKAFLPIFYNSTIYPLLYLIGKEIYESHIFHKCEVIVESDQIPFIKSVSTLFSEDQIPFSFEITKQKKLGFGGAISSSRYIYKTKFTLISLGDYIYKSYIKDNCTRQLIRTWLTYQTMVVGIKKVKINESKNHGIVHGTWISDGILEIDSMVEKPNVELANKMVVKENNKDELYGFFGLYIINNDVIQNMTKADSALEIGLTEYLSEYLVEHNIYGVLIEGDSFDVGNPKDYYQTLINYGE